MDIAISKVMHAVEVREAFEVALPGASVEVLESLDDIVRRTSDVVVVIHSNDSEFPTGLSVFASMQPGADFEAWLRLLSRALSLFTKARIICDGTPFGLNRAPFWSVIWDAGVPWLADDSGSRYADGGHDVVRIVRELDPSHFGADHATFRNWLLPWS